MRIRVSSGVSGEPHTHHVVDFALLKIGAAINMIKRRHLRLALGFRGPHAELDQRSRVLGAIELVIDLDAVFIVHALKAGEVIVADRVLVAQVECDVDQLLRRHEQGGLNDRNRGAADLGVDPLGQLFEPGLTEPDERRPALRPV